jgi:predicted transcriptional regulator
MATNEIHIPTTSNELDSAILIRVKNDPGAIIATIIRPFRKEIGEQVLRSRIRKLEEKGLITTQHKFGRIYVFPKE